MQAAGNIEEVRSWRRCGEEGNPRRQFVAVERSVSPKIDLGIGSDARMIANEEG